MIRRTLFMLTFLLMPYLSIAQGLYFGQNKVQYDNFTWHFIQSDHFDVYYYDEGYELAQFTARTAEEAYKSIRNTFRYQLTDRVMIVVYVSHNDFQQTNVVDPYMHEGIGGVTELFKNRIVVPFRGDYGEFRHVLHHELVHAVVNDMFYGGSLQSAISNNIRLQIPLWFNEGIAEYEALGWDTESDMFMYDAVINEYLPKSISHLNGYLAYRGGQSVWYYIAEKYGHQKISDILHRVKRTGSVERGFTAAIGLNLKELSEEWFYAQKQRYMPDIAERQRATDFAERMTNHKKDNSFYNASPTISPQGDKIAFISDRDDYYSVYVMSAIDGKILQRVIKGYNTTDFEQLHLLTPGISWSPDGQYISLAAKSQGEDVIYIVPVDRGKRRKLTFDLDAIYTVRWSPTGNHLAFIGTKNHKPNLYIYDLHENNLIQLTDDVFSDSDPVWSHDGTEIYYISNRGNYLSVNDIPDNFRLIDHDLNSSDLFAIDIETKNIKRLTDAPDNIKSPLVSSGGKHLLFISDRNGIYNIYQWNLETDKIRPITNSLNPIHQMSLSADDTKLTFSSFVEGGYDVFLMNNPLKDTIDVAELPPTEFIKRQNKITALDMLGSIPIPVERKLHSEAPDTITGVPVDTVAEKGVYGDDISIDFSTYIFDDRNSILQDTTLTGTEIPSIEGNIDEEGNFIPDQYTIKFTLDYALASAGYSTFWGFQGSTYLAFSDLLGNHRILLLADIQYDFKNSIYGAGYFNLAGRTDWGVIGYHIPLYLYQYDQYERVSLYRYRKYGFDAMASHPFDRFRRIDGSIGFYTLTSENLTWQGESERRYILYPSLSYVFDNTLWGYTAPRRGQRYNITIQGSPKISDSSVGFMTVMADYRTYTSIGRDYTIALRLSGGSSFGPDPQRFMIGGIDGWINYEFEQGYPIQNVEDFMFLTPVLPMRGYNYNAQYGSNFALVNFEMHYPLIRYLLGGMVPLSLQNVRGVTFIDVGSAWDDFSSFRAFEKTEYGNYRTKDLLIGAGIGARFYLFAFPFRFDIAWNYNLDRWSKPMYYFSIAFDI